jgi:hypothetical protein
MDDGLGGGGPHPRPRDRSSAERGGPEANRIFAALAAGDRTTAERHHAHLRELDARAAAFVGPVLIEQW